MEKQNKTRSMGHFYGKYYQKMSSFFGYNASEKQLE